MTKRRMGGLGVAACLCMAVALGNSGMAGAAPTEYQAIGWQLHRGCP